MSICYHEYEAVKEPLGQGAVSAGNEKILYTQNTEVSFEAPEQDFLIFFFKVPVLFDHLTTLKTFHFRNLYVCPQMQDLISGFHIPTETQ